MSDNVETLPEFIALKDDLERLIDNIAQEIIRNLRFRIHNYSYDDQPVYSDNDTSNNFTLGIKITPNDIVEITNFNIFKAGNSLLLNYMWKQVEKRVAFYLRAIMAEATAKMDSFLALT